MLASLRPAKRERPLVAVIGINDATETTDYLLHTGILRRADVTMLATDAGPVRLYPALAVEPDATIAQFDAAYPEDADFVIVPAMSRDDDPAVIGICAGAKVVGAAGLLDGKRATTHWYYLDEMLKRSPTIRYAADQRMVADEGMVMTTGLSPLPADTDWPSGAGHGRGVAGAGCRCMVADRPVECHELRRLARRCGDRIVPDQVGADWSEGRRVSTFPDRKPADALDLALDAIIARYGNGTADVVAMQIEYPRQTASQ